MSAGGAGQHVVVDIVFAGDSPESRWSCPCGATTSWSTIESTESTAADHARWHVLTAPDDPAPDWPLPEG